MINRYLCDVPRDHPVLIEWAGRYADNQIIRGEDHYNPDSCDNIIDFVMMYIDLTHTTRDLIAHAKKKLDLNFSRDNVYVKYVWETYVRILAHRLKTEANIILPPPAQRKNKHFAYIRTITRFWLPSKNENNTALMHAMRIVKSEVQAFFGTPVQVLNEPTTARKAKPIRQDILWICGTRCCIRNFASPTYKKPSAQSVMVSIKNLLETRFCVVVMEYCNQPTAIFKIPSRSVMQQLLPERALKEHECCGTHKAETQGDVTIQLADPVWQPYTAPDKWIQFNPRKKIDPTKPSPFSFIEKKKKKRPGS